jgi:hypothetical protein
MPGEVRAAALAVASGAPAHSGPVKRRTVDPGFGDSEDSRSVTGGWRGWVGGGQLRGCGRHEIAFLNQPDAARSFDPFVNGFADCYPDSGDLRCCAHVGPMPAIAPAPVSPWRNGSPERGLAPPLFPEVERIRRSGLVETLHCALAFDVSVAFASPSRVSRAGRLVEGAFDDADFEMDQDVGVKGFGDVRGEVGDFEDAGGDLACPRVDLSCQWCGIGSREHGGIGELDPDVGAVFGEGHRVRCSIGAGDRHQGAQDRKRQTKGGVRMRGDGRTKRIYTPFYLSSVGVSLTVLGA